MQYRIIRIFGKAEYFFRRRLTSGPDEDKRDAGDLPDRARGVLTAQRVKSVDPDIGSGRGSARQAFVRALDKTVAEAAPILRIPVDPI